MILKPPISDEEIRKLEVGDIVFVDGIIATLRDEGHNKALKSELPYDLSEGILYHCGPLVVDSKKVLAAGPTTSTRMNDVESLFIERFNIRAIIGKGGMDSKVKDSMQENGCVYLAMTGGCAAITANAIKRIVDCKWPELGMPEAMWIFEVASLGPLVVAIDTRGNSLYEDAQNNVQKNLDKILKEWSS